MRFSRDKRGYENTFVVHTGRRRGKSRSRILYWFRTPPGVRVGRSALDADAIRLLEEFNPDVEFDWTRMLKAPPESVPEPQSQPRAQRRQDEPRRSAPPAPRPPVPSAETARAPVPPIVPLDLEDAEPPAERPAADAPPAALARLGPEGLQRLRGRYAELITRIGQRVHDPARQEELKSKAERLNPDNWVTDDEVTLGLDAYEATFDEIRSVVGRPRKRRRRRRGSRPEGTPVNGETGVGEPDQDSEAEPDDADEETP